MVVSLDTIVTALGDAGLLIERRGTLPAVVTGVADDSRRVQAGGLFVAVRGSERDGHDYLDRAERAGAVVAIVEDPGRTSLPRLVVRHSRRAAAIVAAAANDWPGRRLQRVGVTGTNGKTTTVNILRHLLDDADAGRLCASVGTLGVLVGSGGDPLDGGDGLTTPGPVELQRLFRQLVDAGVGRVAMEVSSHALDQRRVEGVELDVAIFTNLTRDHLDYHGTMDAYRAAKASLVTLVKPHGTVVVNRDDDAWIGLDAGRNSLGFSEGQATADVRAEGVRFDSRGSQWTLVLHGEGYPVSLPLIGDFNVANALGAAAGALALGLTGERIAERLSSVPQVPGRLELLNAGQSPAVLRDYAHTPDALARALSAVRPFAAERLIVVFGCGGDRDRGKRPQMGAIAVAQADLAIVTSDNPRTEDPERILDEIEAGMDGRTHERIEDRRAAIARALDVASARDVVVLAGKGHETYQIRGTTHYPFDEKVIVDQLFAERRRAPASPGVGRR